MIIKAKEGWSLWLLLHYCVHWDGILCAYPRQIVGLRNWIPSPAKLETTMDFTRHEKAALLRDLFGTFTDLMEQNILGIL